MTKDELTTVLAIAGVEIKIIEAMTQAYEMGFEHGAKVSANMRDAIEFGLSMCEHLDLDEVDNAQKMAFNFRHALGNN